MRVDVLRTALELPLPFVRAEPSRIFRYRSEAIRRILLREEAAASPSGPP